MRQEIREKQKNCRRARRHILEAYIVLLLAVFPFYNTDHYFSLLSDRAGFFQAATWVMAAALLAEEVLYRIRIREGARRCSIRGWIWRIPPEYAFLTVFLLASTISTLLSDHRAEAWTGEAGRLQGLFMWLAYGTAFFCISRPFCPGKRHIWLFLASGAIAALWGICDYMGPGLSWWLADVKEPQKHMFTSSIGNINTYTAFLVIGFSLSGAYAVFQDMRGKWAKQEKAILLAVFFLFSVALATGRSDNAVIGIAAFFLAFPAGIRDTRQASRYLGLFAVFLAAFPAAALLSTHTRNPYMEVPDGILLKAGIQGGAFFFIPSVAAAVAAFCMSREEKPLCRLQRVWPALLAVSGVFFIMVFLDANLFPDTGRYGASRAYLEFNDGWGTYRGLCWRLAHKSYGKFPFIKKLIGSGPETFGIIMKQENYQEMVQGCGQVFDSPHNEIIQYLFCTGILGAACYYAFLASCLWKGIHGDAVRKTAAIAAIAYTAVSFVNISVPITQPYLIMLAAWCSSQKKEEQEEKSIC